MICINFLSWASHWQRPNTISCQNCYCMYCYYTNAFEKIISFVVKGIQRTSTAYSSWGADGIFLIILFQGPIQGLPNTIQGLKFILMCTWREHEKTFRILSHKFYRKKHIKNLNIIKQSWAIQILWTKMNPSHQSSAVGHVYSIGARRQRVFRLSPSVMWFKCCIDWNTSTQFIKCKVLWLTGCKQDEYPFLWLY